MVQCGMPITVHDIVTALALLGGEATVEDIHRKVVEVAARPIPVSSRQIVRARLQEHCSRSSSYNGRGSLFRNVHGLDSRRGVWALEAPSKSLRSVPAAGDLSSASSTRERLPKAKRNPTWNRDELILALDLYAANPAKPPSKESAAVGELAALLNKLHRLNGATMTDTLRNPNGVYLKMMNLRALDPTFIAQGKVGMTSGGKLEKTVWDEYQGRRGELAADASAIRHAISTAGEVSPAPLPPSDPYEAEEGGVVLRLHRSYERDRRLVAEKKKQAKAEGKIACEVCNFDFEERYGPLGADFIEVHHTRPIHTMKAGLKTKLADLALLCSNCHRMAHRTRSPLSLAELRAALQLPRTRMERD